MESSDLEDRFLTFLDHPQNHKSMKKYLQKNYQYYKHDFDFLCDVVHFKKTDDETERYQKCRKLLHNYFSSGKNNNRKPPAYEISVSDELIKSISDNVWQYRGGKIEIPTYIFDEPYDVVSGLLARRIFGLYTEYMQQRRKVARNSIKMAMEREYEIEKNKVAATSSALGRPGAARRESIKKTRMLFGVTNRLGKIVKNIFFNEDGSLDSSISGNSKSMKVQAQHQVGIYKQGWLHKKGGKRTNWNRRWFILKRDAMYYFKAPESTRPLGMIYLHGMKVCPASRDMRQKHPNTFLVIPAAVDQREKRTYYLHPDAGFQQDEEKKWRNAISEGCNRAESRSSAIDLPTRTRESSGSGSSSDASSSSTDEDEVDTTTVPQLDYQNDSGVEVESAAPNVPRPRRHRRRRRQRQDDQLSEDKKSTAQPSTAELEEYSETESEQDLEIDSDTPIRVMLTKMEDNPNDYDIQSSCLSILREHCISLDGEDIRGKGRRRWIRVVDCIVSAIKRFGMKESLLVDGVVCLSILSSINEIFRQIIVEDEGIVDYVYDHGYRTIRRSDLRRAYRKALATLEKNAYVSEEDAAYFDEDGKKMQRPRRRFNENRRYSGARRRRSSCRSGAVNAVEDSMRRRKSSITADNIVDRRRRGSSIFDASYSSNRGDINNARQRRGSSMFYKK